MIVGAPSVEIQRGGGSDNINIAAHSRPKTYKRELNGDSVT